jgi:hypothetical protein
MGIAALAQLDDGIACIITPKIISINCFIYNNNNICYIKISTILIDLIFFFFLKKKREEEKNYIIEIFL